MALCKHDTTTNRFQCVYNNFYRAPISNLFRIYIKWFDSFVDSIVLLS